MQDIAVASIRSDLAIGGGVVDYILVPEIDEGIEESAASVDEGD